MLNVLNFIESKKEDKETNKHKKTQALENLDNHLIRFSKNIENVFDRIVQ